MKKLIAVIVFIVLIFSAVVADAHCKGKGGHGKPEGEDHYTINL